MATKSKTRAKKTVYPTRVRPPELRSVTFRPGGVLYGELISRSTGGSPPSEVAKRDLMRLYRVARPPENWGATVSELVAKAVRAHAVDWLTPAPAVLAGAVAAFPDFTPEERAHLLGVAIPAIDEVAAVLFLAWAAKDPEATATTDGEPDGEGA